MASIPTTDDATDAGMTGLKAGGAASIGQTLGRGILGPGLGTALGGTVAAAAMSGDARDMVATLSVERGMNELFAGGGGGGSRGNERVM
jgi:hypothetical protein